MNINSLYKYIGITIVLLGFVILIIIITFLQKEIVEKIFIVSPFLILWLSYIREKQKEERRTQKDEREKEENLQHFFDNFIGWIEGGKERSSYLENYVLRNFAKYERFFRISILRINELSPDEREYYKKLGSDGEVIPIYLIYVLGGRFILEYYVKPIGDEFEVSIVFKKPQASNYKDIKFFSKKPMKQRITKLMKQEIIYHVRDNHGLSLYMGFLG